MSDVKTLKFKILCTIIHKKHKYLKYLMKAIYKIKIKCF